MEIGRIDSALAQLRAAAAMAGGVPATTAAPTGAGPADFGAALKGALDQVAASQNRAQALSQAFSTGTTDLNLSDVMVQIQKSNVSFQAAVQVRNKLVSAYHDIMNMQV